MRERGLFTLSIQQGHLEFQGERRMIKWRGGEREEEDRTVSPTLTRRVFIVSLCWIL